jgi:hypothetical protein
MTATKTIHHSFSGGSWYALFNNRAQTNPAANPTTMALSMIIYRPMNPPPSSGAAAPRTSNARVTTIKIIRTFVASSVETNETTRENSFFILDSFLLICTTINKDRLPSRLHFYPILAVFWHLPYDFLKILQLLS